MRQACATKQKPHVDADSSSEDDGEYTNIHFANCHITLRILTIIWTFAMVSIIMAPYSAILLVLTDWGWGWGLGWEFIYKIRDQTFYCSLWIPIIISSLNRNLGVWSVSFSLSWQWEELVGPVWYVHLLVSCKVCETEEEARNKKMVLSHMQRTKWLV